MAKCHNCGRNTWDGRKCSACGRYKGNEQPSAMGYILLFVILYLVLSGGSC